MTYPKYLIKDTDQFNEWDFPKIIDDLDIIVAAMGDAPTSQDPEMLLSFARDHSLNGRSITDNPVLAQLITAKALPTGNLEALFASSSKNAAFQKQLEDYITSRFKSAAIS
jgi:protein-disulfide isomerase-like protein with CxxC motif